MSPQIRTAAAFAAPVAVFALLGPSASASTSDFNISLTDATGSSSLSSGTFALSAPLPLHIAGSVMQRDADNNGFGDNPLDITYDQNLILSNAVILLHLAPGAHTAFSDSGPLSTTFDWSITMYDSVPTFAGPAPLGSPLFGTAEILADQTILHINQGLLWAAGLNSPFWGGYVLPDLSALRLTQDQQGAFTLSSVGVPAPASALLVLAFPLTASRRRRR